MPKKKSTPANPSGLDRSSKQSRVSLAAHYRARYPKELQEEFYDIIMQGKRPMMVHVDDCEHKECALAAARGDEPCNKHFVEDEVVERSLRPTLDHMMLAMARIKDRAYGQAPQHHVVEAELRAEVTAIAGGVDPRYFQRLSPQALEAIARAVRGTNPAPLPEASDRNLIEAVTGDAVPDAEFEEVVDDE